MQGDYCIMDDHTIRTSSPPLDRFTTGMAGNRDRLFELAISSNMKTLHTMFRKLVKIGNIRRTKKQKE